MNAAKSAKQAFYSFYNFKMFFAPNHDWNKVNEGSRSYLNGGLFSLLFPHLPLTLFKSWFSGPVMWKSKAVSSNVR